MNIIKKEWHLIFLIALPIAYLAFLYASLPNEVPIHWGLDGQVDRYGGKAYLFILAMIPLTIYFVLSIAPRIDPKQKLDSMGNKFRKIKNLLTVFMSCLVLYLFYAIAQGGQLSIHILFIAIGIFYLVFGNYFKTIKPNYLMGIRTPWTLRNEKNWKDTHVLGGKMWFVGGVLIVLHGLFGEEGFDVYVFVCVTVLIIVIPVVYSFVQHLKKI